MSSILNPEETTLSAELSRVGSAPISKPEDTPEEHERNGTLMYAYLNEIQM